MLHLCSDRLKNERKKAKITQQKLALLLDVSDMTIKRWETGVTPIPSDKLILMKSLGLDVSYILFGESDNALSQDDVVLLKQIHQASPETRNKIFMLLLSGAEMPVSPVINKDNVVNGQLVGDNNEQINNFGDTQISTVKVKKMRKGTIVGIKNN